MSNKISKYRTELEELFNQWRKTYSLEYFVEDGIIDPNYFFECKLKVLFITKESNDCYDDDMDSNEKTYNLCNEILKPENYKSFIRHMIQWTWAINENFPQIEEFNDELKEEFIRSFAIMNLKKSGGRETSDDSTILEYAKKDKDFIRKEIEIIDPDVIIGLRSCPISNFIDIDSKRKYIEFYHPSYHERGLTDKIFLDRLRNLYSDK